MGTLYVRGNSYICLNYNRLNYLCQFHYYIWPMNDIVALDIVGVNS